MIKLDFAVPDSVDWDNWIDSCEAATSALIQSHQNGAPVAITDLYRGQLPRYHSHPFFGKCAYCESKVETTSPDYVEHFRPKAGVRDIDNNVVNITVNGAQIPHYGYYWLAYKWENLLPTCWKCNTWHTDDNENMVGKGNRFPVNGTYAISPGEEIDETAELINPMFEDPSEHISVDKLGVLHSVPDSLKGDICINFFGLNIREALVNGRKREYENIDRKVRFLLVTPNEEQKAKEIAEIKTILTGHDEYTIAARKAFSDVILDVQNIQNSIQS